MQQQLIARGELLNSELAIAVAVAVAIAIAIAIAITRAIAVTTEPTVVGAVTATALSPATEN